MTNYERAPDGRMKAHEDLRWDERSAHYWRVSASLRRKQAVHMLEAAGLATTTVKRDECIARAATYALDADRCMTNLAKWEKARATRLDHPLAAIVSPRCSAPGCGDKIKEGPLYEVRRGNLVEYVEEGCVDAYVYGHPDYGHPRGHVDGLPVRSEHDEA
jgi:hypothetical protein